MKRFVSLFIVSLFAFASLCGCEGQSEDSSLPASPSEAETAYEKPLIELREGYSADAAKKDGLVVFDGMDLLSGEEVWQDFVEKTSRGEAARVRLYNEYESDYFVSDVVFDGSTYTRTLYDKHGDTVEWFLSEATYKYLVHDCFTGGSGERQIEYYFLANDQSVTASGWFGATTSSTLIPSEDDIYSSCWPIYSKNIDD